MGLRSMKWDEWIGKPALSPSSSLTRSGINHDSELDNHYLRYHADKAHRIQERGDKCCATAPEAWDAAIELLEELYATHPPPIRYLTNTTS